MTNKQNFLTLDDIKSKIVGVDYHNFPETTVTVCCLKLANGYNALGESACVNPENFDKHIGEKIAFDNAVEKIWQLEGYLLKQALFEQSKSSTEA
jgi:hypothetical protein